VYVLYHSAVDKRYFGITSDATTRLASHRRSPPRHLRNALLAGAPPGTKYTPDLFDANVTFFVLSSDNTERVAKRKEREYIRTWKTTKRAHGYNILQGTPGSDRRFRYMKATGVL
jgi:hypothetical protein